MSRGAWKVPPVQLAPMKYRPVTRTDGEIWTVWSASVWVPATTVLAEASSTASVGLRSPFGSDQMPTRAGVPFTGPPPKGSEPHAVLIDLTTVVTPVSPWDWSQRMSHVTSFTPTEFSVEPS